MIKYIISPLRRPKLSNKVWLTRKELAPFFKKVIWITQCAELSSSLMLMKDRIRRLIKKSGFQFTFLYLKESYRLVIRYLSDHGEPDTVLPNTVMVKRDHVGLPTIIPLQLRHILMDWRNNQRMVACILSCLSVFRVFPTKVKPSLGTISEPFNGTIRSFDSDKLTLALKEIIPGITLRINPPKLIKLESSSPNAFKSTWGSSLDSLAFLGNINVLTSISAYLWRYGGRWLLLWLYGLILVSLPLIFVLKMCGVYETPHLGKLSVVYDQAGKARVIAITNWWIQASLKPLHSAIMRSLARLATDGTFDQQAPLERLISKVPEGQTFHSFDLSAATDRLPIDIQRDILDFLKPGLGTLWSKILDIKWYLPERVFGYHSVDHVSYSVGQPMGAYSSWAMLALTHHVIVRVAARNVGIRNFTDYAILGDDVVIANDDVAKEYYNLMKLLGVSINLSKSVVSKDFCEFAKVWKGPNVQITPIGPGLVLRVIRDKKYVGAFLSEARKLNLVRNFTEALSAISSLRTSHWRTETDNALWSCFGLNAIKGESHDDANAISWCFSSPVAKLPDLRYHIYNSLLQLRIDDFKEAQNQLEKDKDYFYLNWWKVFACNQWPHRLIEAWLKLVGPGFWTYALGYIRDEQVKLSLPNANPTWEVIRDLAKADVLLNSSSVDWTQKAQIKAQNKKYHKLLDEIDRSRSELMDDISMFGIDP